MTRSGLARLLVLGILAVVVALSVAAVRSTGALWSDRATTGAATLNTGQLKLVAGTGSGTTYQFQALNGSGILTGQPIQAPLAITNSGSTPLRYKLNAAGPQVTTTGHSVSVSLSGTVLPTGGSCGAGTMPGAAAFTAFTAGSSSQAATSSWRSLAKGATETWCIRSTLLTVNGTGSPNFSTSFTVLFTFGSEQTRS
ncbi:hypothetical protein DFJ75_0981 [Williamsia muralis]|uniref:Ribosomally synthesized peptide with SipW-like signal peptide n=1 Tax=Williamsia marianensis TaxID=85044 RepID=A0A495JYY3_WILMA|nr:hypothetical protein [Williamsia muralis]RKR94190.1 hypothetical protein DFJ75_0981 [Williamsia muralis]